MPFKSRKQMKFLYAKHPKIAKKWSEEYGVSKSLPDKVTTDKAMKNTRGRGRKK